MSIYFTQNFKMSFKLITNAFVALILLKKVDGNFRRQDEENMIFLQGGSFQMGINDQIEGRNGESPAFKTAVKPFKIDRYPVTNEDFQRFLNLKPSFRTDAEIRGWSQVFAGHLGDVPNWSAHHAPDPETPWMIPVIGAKWNEVIKLFLKVKQKWLLF